MSLLQDVVASAAPSPAGRRHRPVRVLAVALLALLIGATMFVVRYDPLASGSGAFGFGREERDYALNADEDISNALGEEFRVVRPAVGTRLGAVLGLTNDGPFAVEVLDVGLPFPPYYFDEPGAFASQARGGVGLPYGPLEPFTLEPDRSRDVGVTFRVAGCPQGDSVASPGTLGLQSVPVTWRFLGITRTTDVPVGYAGTIEGFPQCSP